MFDVFAMICPVKMRWILTCVAAGFLLVVTPAGAQDYEATRHAAEQGDADAQFNLGSMYATGRGVPQDDAEAVRWYRLATEQGDASAQYLVGFAYATGRGVPEDDVTAHMWLNVAAATGDEAARTARENVAARMTREQIAEAQARAREWANRELP